MRAIDLHVDWPLQYAAESAAYDPTLYPGVADRIGQSEGYLGAMTAAVVAIFRREEDWKAQADPWRALDLLIARVEAEFSGRLFRDPIDLVRWRDDTEGMAWAAIGVEGFDHLILSVDDLPRLETLARRGVLVFQPTYGPSGVLAGSSAAGDDRGLLDLGVRFLETLAGRGGIAARPVIDLAHLNPRSMGDVLGWFEADPIRGERLGLVYSHGGVVREGYDVPRAITLDNVARLRALGGTIGLGVTPPFVGDANQIVAAVETIAATPFLGRVGHEGIAVGTDFLGVEATLPGIGTAAEVIGWFEAGFAPEVARALLYENARSLLARAIGGPEASA